MDFRTRICLLIIAIGMANFLAYAIGYTVVGGESVRGHIYEVEKTGTRYYYLDSDKEVSRDKFVYIGIHSISIWVTVAAVMLAMLTMAKDRIADSMRDAAMRGRTFCTILAIVVLVSMTALTFLFVREFVIEFENPEIVQSRPTKQMVQSPQATPTTLPAPDSDGSK
ncbi:MAG: hypothetical protein KAR11_01095 [Phycisphaerae bacterium]|nr:hypothetical protein [Phycisphaerae bacterium]